MRLTNGQILRDAARYRWLREHFRFTDDSMSELWFESSIDTDVYGDPEPEELDASIDAAMGDA